MSVARLAEYCRWLYQALDDERDPDRLQELLRRLDRYFTVYKEKLIRQNTDK
jgi:hypothetical protein